MRRDLPTGTVTFLFTDVEGSTKKGQQARAVITVKAKDEAGNTSTSKRTVVVQR